MGLPVIGTLVDRWKAHRRTASVRLRRLEWNQDGIRLIVLFKDGDEECAWNINWSQVRNLTAFKVDLLAYDCICLEIEDSAGSFWTITEEESEWEGFMRSLPVHLPGARTWDDVRNEVALPPFETRLTVVYSRPDGKPGL
jgi:hypothetical protein